MRNCWCCSHEFENENEICTCPNCGSEIDRTFYKPEVPLAERNKMIPQAPQGQGKQFEPFLVLPNILEGKKGEIEVGTAVTIIDEFKAPESPKLKSPLIGVVNTPVGKRTIGLNWTSYYSLAGTLGKDTSDWVGKEIVYQGMKKSAKGAAGHMWSAKQ